MKRVLVISYHYPQDGAVGGLRWHGLAKYLSRSGWHVAVLTAAAAERVDQSDGVAVTSCPRRRTLDDWYKSFRGRAGRSRPTGVGTSRERGHERPRGGFFAAVRAEAAALLAMPDHARGWVARAARHARAIIRDFQPEVVVSSGPPHSAHLVARLATRGQLPWLIDLRDPWASPPNPWDDLAGSRLFRAIVPRLERAVFSRATGLIANTQELADELERHFPDRSITWVPNGVDPEGLPVRSAIPFPGMAIACVGTLYGRRDPRPLMRAFQRFMETHPDARRQGSKLRMAGHVDQRHLERVRNEITALGLTDAVELLGPVPRPDALDLVARSRLALVLAQDQDLQIPAKLYEMVGIGIPTLVIAGEASATGREGRRLGAAVADSDDLDAIVQTLERVWAADGWGPEARAQGVSYERIAELMGGVLDSVRRPSPARADLVGKTATAGFEHVR